MADKPSGDIDQLCINTIRTLSIDAIQKANSGHPGTPMALAPVAYVLWQRFLRFDPPDPIWPNRDRFVLSGGPRLDAALLAAPPGRGAGRSIPTTRWSGTPSVSLDDIKRFRQLDSQVPRPPRVPLDLGRRDDHRPARPGDRDQRRDGDRLEVAGARTTTAPASSCSTSTSTRSPATAA